MSNFDTAFSYVCGNEGRYSNDAADRGGETFYGISVAARRDHRCPEHKSGVSGDAFRAAPDGGLALAQHIARLDYWRFDAITDDRVATKLFDIAFNVGNPIALIQRAFDCKADGVFGPATAAAINKLDPDAAIERLCLAVADKYTGIVIADITARMRRYGVPETELKISQLSFLTGWMRRAVRRPPSSSVSPAAPAKKGRS